MILHKKAKDLIRKTPTDEVDMKLLCNALEFLATEYRDVMESQITEDEKKRRCSEKYNRPFEVTPVANTTIEFTPSEYKIKYNYGNKEKRLECPLDLHLMPKTPSPYGVSPEG
ncbi:MAG: hypothetical protein GX115_17545 [Ruminiclostridium sp.]|nr:hypothetical protein [Ruminiclostridium sp.]